MQFQQHNRTQKNISQHSKKHGFLYILKHVRRGIFKWITATSALQVRHMFSQWLQNCRICRHEQVNLVLPMKRPMECYLFWHSYVFFCNNMQQSIAWSVYKQPQLSCQCCLFPVWQLSVNTGRVQNTASEELEADLSNRGASICRPGNSVNHLCTILRRRSSRSRTSPVQTSSLRSCWLSVHLLAEGKPANILSKKHDPISPKSLNESYAGGFLCRL